MTCTYVCAKTTSKTNAMCSVYGLACDYVVFAEVFSHQFQNLFPNVLVEVCPGGFLDAPDVKKYSILVMDVHHILRLKTHICIHLAMETNHSLFFKKNQYTKPGYLLSWFAFIY